MAEESYIATHQPCPSCGSKDARCINADGSSYCFSCSEFTKSTNQGEVISTQHTNSNFIKGQYGALTSRSINQDTCKKFSYQVADVQGQACQIANYFNLDGKPLGQKYRYAGKKFRSSGELNFFFGQHLWPNGSPDRMLVITEGELDCLSVSQAQGNKWPVVSLPSGAQSAGQMFKRHYEWLDRFKDIVLMFDNDDVGNKAIEESVGFLPTGKVKIAKLPLKDANDMLVAGRSKELISAIWDSKPWSPDDIVAGDELLERLINPQHKESVDYPFAGLQKLTRGLRRGEIVTFCAGSGIGKSQVCRVITHHVLKNTDQKVGYIALEESIDRTALGIIGIEMNKQLHLDPYNADEEFKAAYQRTIGSGRFFLYDHFGSTDGENLLSRIRFLAKCYGVQFVVLDHLSVVVSGLTGGEGERKMIDIIMTKLRMLVQETNISLLLVSHLKRPEGRAFENGNTVSLSDLRGSRSIACLSDMVVALERIQQDEEDRNKTTVRVLKNRFSGETGIACELLFDTTTGKLSEFGDEQISTSF